MMAAPPPIRVRVSEPPRSLAYILLHQRAKKTALATPRNRILSPPIGPTSHHIMNYTLTSHASTSPLPPIVTHSPQCSIGLSRGTGVSSSSRFSKLSPCFLTIATVVTAINSTHPLHPFHIPLLATLDCVHPSRSCCCSNQAHIPPRCPDHPPPDHQ